ncbi:LOW QUALITY PROTEIN: ciliary microtubule inner protein 5 [Acridotheres tristis]
MDKLERGSGIGRNTLVRSQLTATTPLGQPAPAPSISAAPNQAELATTAQMATWAADEQAEQVQQDKIWKSVEAEQRRRIWYQNWSFLKDHDQMGKRRKQKPLSNYVVLSSKVPNSTNQTIGSQMNTELGRALVNKFFSSGAKWKLEGELQLS